MTWKTMDLFNPTDEHQMLRESLQQWVAEELEPQALESDRKEQFNLALFRKLGELGLLGITVPEEFGGSGLAAVAAVIAHEELSYSDPGFCLAYLAHSMLCVNNMAAHASPEQKQKYLPKLCSGEWVGAMAMSEANYGTDVLGMETTAVKKGDKYIINGSKMWITNGCIDDNGTPCDVLWLYARTGTKDGRAEISTFIIEKDTPGFKVGQKIMDKLGMRGSNTAELVFDNCEVPAENLVGEEGSSITHMMRNLEIERVTLAAMALGIAKRCVDVMNKYAQERMAFGQPIAKFGQIQKFIGESYAQYQSARAYVYNTARMLKVDGTGNRMDSDGVKLVATPMAKQVADNAIQVLGGYGYVGEYVVERLWRDAKLLEIGGGTLEAHQKNITNDLRKLI
jgi:isovaleryl-CoA dehydrogenase